MKKVMMIAALAATMVSCQSKGNQNNVTEDANVATTVESGVAAVYEGVLPAADGPGIKYSLNLNNAADAESSYTLVMTYIDAEGKGKDKSITTSGKKELVSKEVNKMKKSAYKLTPIGSDVAVYFAVINDSTLRLVNEDLQDNVSNLNYDIVKVK